jgi:hypothetical protein
MTHLLDSFSRRARRLAELSRLAWMAWQVANRARSDPNRSPVVFFNASTRISGLSQNAAFSLLTSWAVRLTGVPVIHFVCHAGMSRCVLGTDEADLSQPMPCGMCIRQSKFNFTGARMAWFVLQHDVRLEAAIRELSLDELIRYEHPLPGSSVKLPLGALILPSLRWRLRLQTLSDDEPTRFLAREFMLSAWNVARKFSVVLENAKPQGVVLFNGMHFPEATAAWLCCQRGVRLVTHESGFQPFSGYFVAGQVTAYPITIPDRELSTEQNARLDADLEKRWQGDFSMAGVKFWHEIHEMSAPLKAKIVAHRQTISVFTNVIFDTTQLHANVAFTDMFAWLDTLLEVVRIHPETLFIFRAHPDESRPGKASRESVAMWFEQKAAGLPNVVFIAPQERISSYDLVQVSKCVLVYNSTISLEATLLGVPALCAARSPFTDYGTVFFEPERIAYLRQLEAFLAADKLSIPDEAVRRTRRFMYCRYYRFSLPFGEFLGSSLPTGYVRLKRFPLRALQQSPTLHALLDGLFGGKPFELDV